MRHFLISLLLACAGAASAQVEPPDPLPFPNLDLDLMQGGPAWLVGDHAKARQHFRAAAQRGHPLGQYNLAMMLLHHEGGPCGSEEAVALLHKAAEGGVDLASEALGRMQDRGTRPQGSRRRPFPCSLPSQARSTTVVGPVQPTVAR
jgi:TPR repeat protein